MAITRYAGDRFTIGAGETKPTGVLDGAVLIDTGNLELYIKRNGAWVEVTGAGSDTLPGAPLNSVQFNNAGAFGGDADLTFTDGNRLNVNKLGISGNIYDSNNSIGNNGMVLTNEGTTGVNWKAIEDVLSGVGGSGVANYVARWADEDTLTSGVLVDNGTNVGINVPSPNFPLEISSSDNATIRIEDTTNTSRLDLRAEDSSVLIRSTSNFPMRFDVNQTERMRIDTAGNVGIGTNDPLGKLVVKAAIPTVYAEVTPTISSALISIVNLQASETTNDQAQLQFNVTGGSYNRVGSIGLIAESASNRKGALVFTTDDAGTRTEKMRIAGDGNVGIGTTNPTGAKLHVNGLTKLGEEGKTEGGAVINYAAFGEIKNGGQTLLGNAVVPGTASNTIQHSKSDAGNYIRMVYSQGIAFHTNITDTINTDVAVASSNQRMLINLDGNVGIGTASPRALLDVSTAVDGDSFPSRITSTDGSFTDEQKLGIEFAQNAVVLNQFYSKYDISLGGWGFGFKGYSSGLTDELFTIGANGNVGIGTGNPDTALHVYGADPVLTIQDSESTVANASAILRIGESDGSANLNNNFALKFAGSASGGDLDISRYNNTSLAAQGVRIKHDGNVGIGTNSPNYKLHTVGGAGVFDVTNASGLDHHLAVTEVATLPDWRPYAGSSTSALQLQSSATRGILLAAKTTGNQDFYNTDGLDIYVASTIGSSSSDKGTLAISVKNDGNVGIGTPSPDSTLSVVGNNWDVIKMSDSELDATNKAAYLTIGHYTNAEESFGLISGRSTSSTNILNLGGNAAGLNTATEIGFYTASNNTTTTGTQRMTIDSSGYVGIGTDPKAKFEVDLNQTNGTLAADNYAHFGGQHMSNGYVMGITLGYREANLLYRKVGIVARGLGDAHARQDLDFLVSTATGSTSVTPSDAKLTISGLTGNVGIGITSSIGGKLHVNNPDATPNTRFSRGTGYIFDLKIDNIITNSAIDYIIEPNQASSGILFRTHNASNTNINALAINRDGNVGIGTIVPEGTLHVFSASAGSVTADQYGDDLVIENSTTVGMSLLCNDGGAAYLYFGDPANNDVGQIVYDHSNNSLILVTNASERMRINGSGNVGIGTADPSQKLHVQGNLRVTGAYYASDNNAGSSNQVLTSTGSGGTDWKSLSQISDTVTGDGTTNKITKWENGPDSDLTDSSFLSESGTTLTNTATATEFTTVNTQLRLPNYGRVAIGAASTNSVLLADVGDNATFNNGEAVIKGENSGNRGTVGHSSGSDLLRLNFSDALGMILNKDGHVGIGTDPKARFEVDLNQTNGTLAADNYAHFGGPHNANGSVMGITLGYREANLLYRKVGIVARGLGDAQARQDLDFLVSTVDSSTSVTPADAKLTISGLTGNVGIGTTAPTGAKLQVAGKVRIDAGTGNDALNLNAYDLLKWDNSSHIHFGGYKTGQWTVLKFYSSSTERLNISSDVNVQGATDLNINGPSRRLSFTSGTGTIRTTTSNKLFLQTNSTDALTIDTSQNVGIGRTSPSNILDILKNQSAATYVNITNTTNDASSQVGVKIDSNSANNYILAHADLRTVARYGIAVGGYGEILSSTGNGLLIGTASNNKPIVFGNNNLERLRIDVDGNVGIGTTSPNKKLEVVDSAAAQILAKGWGPDSAGNDGGAIQLGEEAAFHGLFSYDNATSILYIDNAYNSSSGDIRFRTKTSGTAITTVTIEGDGDVGIGTTSPIGKLHIYKSDGSLNYLEANPSTEDASLGSIYGRWNGSNAGLISFRSGSDTTNKDNGDIAFYTSTAGGSLVRAMTIDENQKVGIGTNDPDHNLQVDGTVSIRPNGSSNDQHYFTTGGVNNPQYIMYNSAGTAVNRFRTDNYSYITGGNVGIGTTLPSQKLHVQGTLRLTGAFYDSNNVAGTSGQVLTSTGSATDWKTLDEISGVTASNPTTTNYVTKWSDGTNEVLTDSIIQDNGNIGIGVAPANGYKLKVDGNGYFSGTLTEASSLAIKENIENFTPSIDKINKIRPVKYNKKGSDKKEIGLIAEELEELFPELVEKDENGNPSGVNYSRAVTVLLGGFKELYKELQEIKKRI